MLYRKRILRLLLVALLGLPLNAAAQSSSLNAFSPYTFYGIGELYTPGSSMIRSMGGTGIAYRSMSETNAMNPAALSAINQRTALFSFGLAGQNFYLSDGALKTSYNTFNVNDIALQLPVAKKLGFGFSVTPYSNIGYRIGSEEIIGDIGSINYVYQGSGTISQIKAGFGYEIFKNISIGAEAVYYHGNLTRTFDASIISFTGTGNYHSVPGERTERINTVLANFGLQADLIKKTDQLLTLGATYQMGGKLRGHVKKHIEIKDINGDDIMLNSYINGFRLPDIYSAGIYMHGLKYSVGADYSYAGWADANAGDPVNDMKYRNTHTIRVGGQYTPNPGDVRHIMNRWNYRAGFRFNNSYIMLQDQPMNDMAFTFGVGIPLGFGRSNRMDVGFEFGRMGTTAGGLIKQDYFKVSVGLTLFGDDYWFVKLRYD